jgi:NAD(P)-dependent dehydrogenase (short-subunit alcohol dehydrogenase family)
MKTIAGKTAFVTGAASGIGLGIARALGRAGVKVMLCDINAGALDAATSALRSADADVDGIQADVSVKAELQAAARATIARFGKVHILVNNAGVGAGGSYGRWPEALKSWVLGVNLVAVIDGIEIFGPLIESHGEGGQIVSTASIGGLVSGSSSLYNVTKYGVVALSEGLRPELAPRGIGVSVLCPGFVNTGIADLGRNVPERFADLAQQVTIHPQMTEALNTLRQQLAAGVDPFYVGELVREGIEGDWPYIFTETQFEPYIQARFVAIHEGFNRIRDRTPVR